MANEELSRKERREEQRRREKLEHKVQFGKEKDGRKLPIRYLSKILGVGILAAIIAGIALYNKRFNPLDRGANFYLDQKRSFEDYIEEKLSFISDPSKRTIYFIAHAHPSPAEGTDEETKKLNEAYNKASLKHQVAVYRVLEGLYKKKGVQVICLEGRMHDDFGDVEDPKRFRRELGPLAWGKLNTLIGSDSSLAEIIERLDYDPTILTKIYEEVYGVGYEERERFDSQKTILPDPKQDPEKFSKEITKHLINRFLRSRDAVKYGLEHSDRLFREGKVKNRNFAVLIGGSHIGDYQDIVREINDGKLPYNAVFIRPKYHEETDKALSNIGVLNLSKKRTLKQKLGLAD